jgi:hypothetical protein
VLHRKILAKFAELMYLLENVVQQRSVSRSSQLPQSVAHHAAHDERTTLDALDRL